MKIWTSGKRGTITANGTALTSSYATIGSVVGAGGYDQASVAINYTQGDETSLEVKVQISDTLDFAVVIERTILSTDASGVSTILDNTFTRTTTGIFEIEIALRKPYFRVQVKATGGTPTGTIGCTYSLINIQR